MSGINQVLVSVCVLMATISVVIGTIGVVRFPDVYTRMQASALVSTLGTMLMVIAGTIFFSALEGLTLKLLLVLPFLYWTASAGSFMTARSAHRTGPDQAPQTIRDDLRERAGTVKQNQ